MKKSDSELFMSLFNYITGKNETGKVIQCSPILPTSFIGETIVLIR